MSASRQKDHMDLYGPNKGISFLSRTGLPIYDSFPEFVVDNWSEETRAKGCTKRENTYLYDSRQQGTGGMYSDRMWQWDAGKMERAMKHLKQGWRSGDPFEYDAMLYAYLGKQVKVTQVIQMQDGRGFDLWYIAFAEPKSEKVPGDFCGKPWNSILQKSECETIARNCMVILKRTGNKWRTLSEEEYLEQRLADGASEYAAKAELPYFRQVLAYTTSAEQAATFSASWAEVLK
jgi:hypothetical protein